MHGKHARVGTRLARLRRAVLAFVVVTLTPIGIAAAPASATFPAATSTPTSYFDFDYGTSYFSPTQDKPQSKLWYNDGSWWALMSTPSDSGQVHIFELMVNHTWRDTGTVVDTRSTSTADALWDGSKLYVASRHASTPLRILRVSYAVATRTWSVDSGFPVTVGSGGSESAAIAKDSRGVLWVTYTQRSTVLVAHTNASDTSWTAPFKPNVPDIAISSDDLSSVIAFNGKVGVMWSDQASDAFRFAIHIDGDSDTQWQVETPESGPNLADDHINLKTVVGDSQGRVFAAVKTSQGDAGEPSTSPLVQVLARSSTGQWTVVTAGTVADGHTRPMIQIDETNQLLYFFATAPVKGGTIYYKTASLSALSFAPGRGTRFLYGGPYTYANNASGTKQPVNSTTGLVILASDAGDHHDYYHAEMAIAAPVAADQTKPTVPTGLTGSAQTSSVELSWNSSSDDVGVTGYTVYRDSSPLTTVTGTTYTDTTVSPSGVYSYSVDAFDAAGNHSDASAPVQVTVPDNPPPPPGGGVTLHGVATGENGTAASLTLPVPAGTVQGDVLLSTVDVRGKPTITAPAGWTLVQDTVNGTSARKATYWHLAGNTEPTGYSWGFSSSVSATGVSLAYSGIDPVSPIDAASSALSTGSTALTATGVTTSTSGDMLVPLYGVAGGVTVAPPAGMTETAEVRLSAGTYLVMSESAQALQAVAGPTGNLTATASASKPWIAHLVALRARP